MLDSVAIPLDSHKREPQGTLWSDIVAKMK